MQIGSLTLDNPVILAPLAGITNLPFRLLCKVAGCSLVCSEMVSSHGLVYKSRKTEKMIASAAEEKPLSVQVFGANPDIMAEAAAIVEASGADILDINFGCAVRKVVKTGAGAALMRTPDIAEALLKAVRRAIRIPLTIKIRSGWDSTGRQAVQIARIAQACGVDAVSVHPRSAQQLFGGQADWSIIAAVKKNISIPVIGNGDIYNGDDAVEMLSQTSCDGVMIGRAAIGNPEIFIHVLSRLKGEPPPVETPGRRFAIMRCYLKASVQYLGEETACSMMRSRLGWFTKGLAHSSRFREAIKHLATEKEGLVLIDAYQESLQQGTKLQA